MGLIMRCAVCIAAIYWFSPVHDRPAEPVRGRAIAGGGTGVGTGTHDTVVTGSVGKPAGSATARPDAAPAREPSPVGMAAEQAARLLNSLDSATRRRLLDALIASQTGDDTTKRP